MPDVLLATCADFAEGEPGHELLDEALARRGVRGVWAVWDDPYVDWAATPLVHVRSTWDYQTRLHDFLGWAHAVGPRLLHGVDAFRWNTDKSYLTDLAGRGTVPVVPTVLASSVVDLRVAAAGFGTAVVKPRVGASGIGVHVVADPETWLPSDSGPWVVQPLLGSVQHEGELSVFVIGGHPVSQVRKVAGRDDIRVHEEHGGTATAVPLTDEAALLAVDAVAATTEILGTELVCARVDLLRDDDGTLLVSEVEITEPGLYLDVVPGNGEALAAALTAHLR